jgi:hypothetical protein
MGIFGENPQQGQVNPENPLGIEQAPDVAANPGQPEGLAADNTGQVQEGQLIQNEPQEQPEIESIDINDSQEKKVAFVKQKFKNQENFVQGIEDLQKKLGRENEKLQISTAEEAIDYYISLEKELGKTSNVDETRQENQQLKQELQGLRDALQQVMFQQYNQPARDPYTGRFMAQQTTQTQPQSQPQPNTDINFDVNAEEFMKEFYEKGPNAESFKKVLKNAVDTLVEPKLLDMQKQQEERESQEQKQVQAQQLKQNYDDQVERIKQAYGEQEFQRYQQNMLQIFNRYPMYLNPQLFPNGWEIVFNEARQMTNNFANQQNTMQNQQQYNAAQKMAARIPNSNPSQRFTSRRPSQEEIEKMQIFQPTKQGGIFG